jgi:hypothetical protein
MQFRDVLLPIYMNNNSYIYYNLLRMLIITMIIRITDIIVIVVNQGSRQIGSLLPLRPFI